MELEKVWEQDISNEFTKGVRRLVKVDDDYFVISSIEAAFDTHKPETLVFPGTPDGVKSFDDVAGGIGMSIEAAEEDLLNVLQGKPRKKRTPMLDPEDGPLGPLGGFLGKLMDAFEQEGR